MRSSAFTVGVLLASFAYALPEISLNKKSNHDANDDLAKLLRRALLDRRQDEDGVTTNVYDIITYSAGGAYYANSEWTSRSESGRNGLLT